MRTKSFVLLGVGFVVVQFCFCYTHAMMIKSQFMQFIWQVRILWLGCSFFYVMKTALTFYEAEIKNSHFTLYKWIELFYIYTCEVAVWVYHDFVLTNMTLKYRSLIQ